jgi:hypothetical protein
MEIDTFQKWLAERGCHFDTRGHRRGEGRRRRPGSKDHPTASLRQERTGLFCLCFYSGADGFAP